MQYAKRMALNGPFLRGGHRARVLITGHRRIEAEEPSASSLFVRSFAALNLERPCTQKPSFKSESRHFSPPILFAHCSRGAGEWSYGYSRIVR